MNFLYLYPCYETAAKAFWDKRELFEGKEYTADLGNLTINIGSDRHVFRYVPIKVHVDLERLGFQSGVVELNGLIEHLIDKVKIELVFLNNYVMKAQALEYELRERARSNPSPKLQTPDAPPAGGTGDGSALELGSKTISGDALLQGRFDF